MRLFWRGRIALACSIALSTLVFLPRAAKAQTCQTSAELDDATRNSITAAAQRYFTMAARGDSASMRQNAIPSLASDFSGVEATVKDHQQDLVGAQSAVKASFLLDAQGATPNSHDEFFCGVWGKNGPTANGTEFFFDNLPHGKYAIVLLDATSPKDRTMFTPILQQTGTDWKLAGLYLIPATIAGHDSDWFLARAREYKTKGQVHNAWLYYIEARSLISPLEFMGNLATDKLYDEAQSVRPSDLPLSGKAVDLVVGATTFKLTKVRPAKIGNDLELFVEYEVPDASSPNQDYQNNFAVMKALLAKYPELRDAFAGVDAVVVDPSKRNYGTLLAMKDIK